VSSAPQVTRVRHELKRRHLTVTRVEHVTPQMLRVVLGGEELRDFTSLGFDDHVKLMFPSAGPEQGAAPAMRDFTPRRFDTQARELWIDFFLHDAGPAATWAAQAAVGQVLQVGGPKGSAVISLAGIDAHVFIGDETALPAICRRLEELPADARVLVMLESDAGTHWPPLAGPPATQVVHVARSPVASAPGQDLIAALREVQLPPGNSFVWVAVESRAARAIRRYLREERGIDKQWIKASGYWQSGVAGKHDSIAEDE
jgi:NADPH-dependent ferric siderophore reductase